MITIAVGKTLPARWSLRPRDRYRLDSHAMVGMTGGNDEDGSYNENGSSSQQAREPVTEAVGRYGGGNIWGSGGTSLRNWQRPNRPRTVVFHAVQGQGRPRNMNYHGIQSGILS